LGRGKRGKTRKFVLPNRTAEDVLVYHGLEVANRGALCFPFVHPSLHQWSGMKRTDRISPVVWTIGVVGIAVTIFFAWTGYRARRAASLDLSLANSAVASGPTSPTATVSAAARQGLPWLLPVPLAPVLEPKEKDEWTNDRDFQLVPHGPREFGGIRFLLDGLIQLRGLNLPDNLRYRTDISLPLPGTNLVGCIHLLGGTRYASAPQTCAQLIWHYEDGSMARTPIVSFQHFRGWIRNPYEQPAHLPYSFSKVVWIAPQPNRTLRLYRTSFANPQPNKPVQSLEFASEMQEPSLFLVGVTLDSLKLGERPDDTADLEPTDSVPGNTIRITVTDPNGSPLPHSVLQVQCEAKNDNKTSRTGSFLTTDSSGVADVNYPPYGLNSLDISASHENFSGRKMQWNPPSGDVVPTSYTLKLGTEVTIGATVVDTDSNPIPGASIVLIRVYMGEDGRPKKGDQPDFPRQTLTTGWDGRWQAAGVPSELVDHVGMIITHSNFIGTNFTSGSDANVEKQLRAQTLKIVLNTGMGAHGLVTDENDNPIADATVWAGRRYYPGRQETKTDSQGRFHFQNVPGGDGTFSVSASGHEPATQNVIVKSDMPDVVFKLRPGHVVHGIVQDENKAPIADVQVTLEGSPGEESYNTYEFSAATDSDGKFSWDGAPAETMKFYIGKEGYEQQREVSLPPDQDNVITLGNPKKLEGLVLDATTGQPIPQFSIRIGQQRGASFPQLYGFIENQDFKSPDGRFTFDLNEADENAIQVWNDDHAVKTETLPAAENGVIQLTIQLDPVAALKGIVTTADGVPIAGVDVAAISGRIGTSLQFRRGHLNSYDQMTRVVTTDEQGAFSLGSPPDSGNVVAAAESGFAFATIEQVRTSHVIILQAYGRIEGTLKIAGAPGAGQDVLYNPPTTGLMSDFQTYKTTTDDQGHFTMEQIPAGEGSIVRLIRTSENSWTHSHNTPVIVHPGQTTQVTLGDSGAVLRGTVRFDNPPTNSTQLILSGNLFPTGPSLPVLNPAGNPLSSATSQIRAPRSISYSFVVNTDGTFQVDSVAPGTYTISVSARPATDRTYTSQSMAIGSRQVTVPDTANPMNPISVGEILLRPTIRR
jgi:hypothetical protein